MIVVGVDEGPFQADRHSRAGREGDRAGNDFGVAIKIIEDRIGREKQVVIVAQSHDGLVQVPEDGNARGVLETAVIGHVAQSDFGDRILFEGKTIVQVDPEIAHENVEGELGPGRDQHSGGVVIRVIQVNRVADAQVELQGVELSNGPESIEINLRAQDEIALLRSSEHDGTSRCENDDGTVFGEIDVVVVFDAHRGAETKLDGADL